MSKRVECNNCKYMYDCERTYLGGCTDGELFDELKPKAAHNTREENETKAMLNAPITELSRLIAENCFLPPSWLAEQVGLSVGVIRSAVAGKKVRPWQEKKIRDFFERRKDDGNDEQKQIEEIRKMAADICNPKCHIGQIGRCEPIEGCVVWKYAKAAVEKGYRKELTEGGGQ